MPAKKSLTADHIAFKTILDGLDGIIHYKTGPIKEILFIVGPMKLDRRSLGIDGTEKSWSCLVVTAICRYHQDDIPKSSIIGTPLFLSARR
jgi:hypothetical protein